MKITKYEHACLDLSEGDTRIVIDPGKFSTSFQNYNNIDALVITHVHSDHFDKETVQKIITANPALQIFTVEQVADQISNQSACVVTHGDLKTSGSLKLKFFGGNHEFYPEFQNIAVMINNTLFHPGDSFTIPSESFEILAAPASAPWLRAKDAGDFIIKCQPKGAFPVHNSLLSELGEELHYRILQAACTENGIDWMVLRPGESIVA